MLKKQINYKYCSKKKQGINRGAKKKKKKTTKNKIKRLSFIWPIDKTLSSGTTPGQSGTWDWWYSAFPKTPA